MNRLNGLKAWIACRYLWVTMMLLSVQALAQSIGPSNLNISGGLFEPSGTAIVSPSVDFELQILDAGDTCVLYSEQHLGQDLSTTKGAFSLQLGSGTSATNFLHGSSSFDVGLFENPGVVAGFSGCASGVTLSATSGRLIRVSYQIGGGGFVAMTPDVPITSAPYAMIAQTLQGKTPANFILTNVNTQLLQANVENVFSNTNYPILQSLLSGGGFNPTSSVSFNSQRLTNLATPILAQDGATKGYVDTTLGGAVLDVAGVSSGVGNGDTLVWNAAQNKWVASALATGVGSITAGNGLTGGTIISSGTLAVDVGITANKILQLNGSAQIPAVDGSQLVNVNASLLGTRPVATTLPTLNQVLGWNVTLAQWMPEAVPAITALTGDVVATGPGSVSATIQNDAVTAAKVHSSSMGVNQLLITNATDGTTLTYAICTANQVLQWTGIGWACTNVSTMLGTSGVTAGTQGSSTQVPVVTVDTTGRVTSLTNVNIAFPVTSVAGRTGAVTLNAADINNLGTAATKDYGVAPNDLVQLNGSSQLPAVDGSLLTNVNSSLIQGKAVSTTPPSDGQILLFNSTSNQYTPVSVSGAGTISDSGVLSLTTTGSSGAFINGGNSFSTTATLGTKDLNPLLFITNNSEHFRLDTSGNLGIGTTTPGAILDINGLGTKSAMIVPRDSSANRPPVAVNGMLRYNTNTASLEGYIGGTWESLATSGTGFTGTSESLSAGLTVGGGANITSGESLSGGLNNNSGGITNVGSLTGVGTNITASGSLTIAAGGSGYLVLNPNVGIGTATPTAALDIYGLGTLSSAVVVPRDTTANRPLGVNGMLRYNTNTASLEGYIAGAWSPLATSGGGFSGTSANLSAGLTVGNGENLTGGLNNNGGGITNAGAISGTSETLSAGLTVSGGINNNNGGITNAGSITGIGTNLTASGSLTIAAGGSGYLVLNPNVGIGTAAPTAALDIYGLGTLSSAVVVPRDTTANRPLGVNGMLRYNTNTASLEGYIGGAWSPLATSGGGLSGTSENLSAGLTVAGGEKLTGGLNNNNGGITNAGSITSVGANITGSAALTIAAGAGQLLTLGGNGGSINLTPNVGIGTATPQGILDVEGSGTVIFNTGYVGIGTTSPTAQFDQELTSTSSSSVTGANFFTTYSGTASNYVNGAAITLHTNGEGSGSTLTGELVYVGDLSGTSSNTSSAVNGQAVSSGSSPTVYGGNFDATANGSGAAQTATGVLAMASSTGGTSVTGLQANGIHISNALTNLYGINTTIWNAGGAATNGYGVYVGALTISTGSLTNYYGLYVANSTAAATNYGLYVAGGKSYFGGNVGIGTASPMAGLDISTTGTSSAVIVPRDTTANRPTTGVNGMIRYNTNTASLEGYIGGSWSPLATSGGGFSGTSANLTAGLTVAAGENLTGGLNNNNGGITNAGTISGTSETLSAGLSVSGGASITGGLNANNGSITSVGANITGSGALTIAAGAGQLLTLGAGGGSINLTPNVGIGTASPRGILDVEGSGTVILNTGFVGIGTTSPSYKLDVNGGSAAADIWSVYAHGNAASNAVWIVADNTNVSSHQGGFMIANQGSQKWVVANDSTAAGKDDFYVQKAGGFTYFDINSNGNVGIGTTSPAGILDVEGGTALANTNGSNINIVAQSAGSGNQNGGNIILQPGTLSGSGFNGAVYVGSNIFIEGGNYDQQLVNASTLSLASDTGFTWMNGGGSANLTSYVANSTFIGVGGTPVFATGVTAPTASIIGISGIPTGAPLFAATVLGNLIGVQGLAGSSAGNANGTVSLSAGGQFGITNTKGKVTAGYGIEVLAPTNANGGVISNYYGLYIQTPTVATTNYALYSQGGTNYFGGNVGIGTASPMAGLDIGMTGTSSAVIVPRDTTANRPLGVNGMLRYNTNTASLEGYIAGSWSPFATSGGGFSGTSENLTAGLTVAAGESLTGGLNNNNGGITNAGTISGTSETLSAGLSVSGGASITGGLNANNGSITSVGANITGSGALTIAAGAGQLLTLGAGGGSINLTPNVGIGTASPRGILDVEGSGTVILNTGFVGIGTTSPAGLFDVQGGTNVSAAGVKINMTGQAGAAGNNAGGKITMTSGTATGTGTGGAMALVAGSSTSGTGGAASLTAGFTGTGNGGAASVVGGNTVNGTGGGAMLSAGGASGVGNGGNAVVAAGIGGTTSGNGGTVSLLGGSAAISGSGGSVSLFAGSAAGGNNNGGNVTFSAGAATGTGTPGNFQFISGNVGIGTTSPAAALQVAGEVQPGNTGLTCSASTKGAIRYDNVNNVLDFCNGTSWNVVQAAACSNATPNTFSFTNLVNQTASTLVTSNIVQVSGMNCSIVVSISGSGSPMFRICQDSACSTVLQSWTPSPSSITTGQYLQVELTTSATGGQAYSATILAGGGASVWSAASGGGCSGLPSTPPPIGTLCPDGTVYAGTTPDGGVPMFTTPCDYGQTWNGASCSGSAITVYWDSYSGSYTATGQTNLSTGKANTAALAGFTTGGGYTDAPYSIAVLCNTLSTTGITEGSGAWYLPSQNEMILMANNYAALGISNTNYWTSTESNASTAVFVGGHVAGWSTWSKNAADPIRCVRH